MTNVVNSPATSTKGHTMTSTAIPSPIPHETRPIPFGRTLAVEFRKAVSTRTNRLLLAFIALTCVATAICTTIWWTDIQKIDTSWMLWQALIFAIPQVLIIPVVVLIVTSEWSTRTAMTTFTLEPRRSLVVAAKLLVATVVTSGMWVFGTGLAATSHAVGAVLTDNDMNFSSVEWYYVLGKLGALLVISLSAFALALLIHNGTATILIALGAPAILATIAFGPEIEAVIRWIYLPDAILVLQSPTPAIAWARFATASSFWLIVPLVLGWVRTLRREAQ